MNLRPPPLTTTWPIPLRLLFPFPYPASTVEGALRAGPDANPPNNMHRALIYQGALVCAAVVWVFGLRGKQARRELYEQAYAGEKLVRVRNEVPTLPDIENQHGWTVGGFQVHSAGDRAVVVVSALIPRRVARSWTDLLFRAD